MTKATWASLAALAFIAGFIIFYRPKPASPPNTPPAENTQETLEAKIDDQANITVVVTPKEVSPQSPEWTFDIGMNTHSVELDQDMTKIAVLVDDSGKEYQPIRWDGPTGGHHREGVLIFNSIRPTPKSLVLKISGIADVVRTFVWQLP